MRSTCMPHAAALLLVVAVAVVSAEFSFEPDFSSFTAQGLSPGGASGTLNSDVFRFETTGFVTGFGETVSGSGVMKQTVTSNTALTTFGVYAIDYGAMAPTIGITPGVSFMNPGSLIFRVRNGPNEATTMDFCLTWVKALALVMDAPATTKVEFQYSIPSQGVQWTTLSTLEPSFGTVGSYETTSDCGTESVQMDKSVWVFFRLHYTSQATTVKVSTVGLDELGISVYSGMERDEQAIDPNHRASQCNPYCDRVPTLRLHDHVNCCQ